MKEKLNYLDSIILESRCKPQIDGKGKRRVWGWKGDWTGSVCL